MLRIEEALEASQALEHAAWIPPEQFTEDATFR